MIWITCALAVLLGHLVKGLTGFGSAIVAIPIVTFVLGPGEAIVLVNVVDVLVGLPLTWNARRDVPWRAVAVTLAVLLPAQALGTWLHSDLPVETVRRIVGVGVMLLSFWLAYQAGRPPQAHGDLVLGRRALFGAGLAGFEGGLMSGIIGMSGPPIVAWTRRWLSPAHGRAYMLALFVPTSAGLVVGFLATGIATPAAPVLGLAVLPVALVGAAVGSRLSRTVAPITFGRVVAGIVFLAALGLVLR